MARRAVTAASTPRGINAETSKHLSEYGFVSGRYWLLWLPVGALVGTLYYLVSLLFPFSVIYGEQVNPSQSYITLAQVVLFTSVFSGISFILFAGSARSALSGRPPKEIANWLITPEVLNRSISTALITALLIVVGFVAGLDIDPLRVLAISSFMYWIAGARAIRLVWKQHWLNFVLIPSQRRAYDNDKIIKGRKRLWVERLLPWQTESHMDNAYLPSVQSLLFICIPPVLMLSLSGKARLMINPESILGTTGVLESALVPVSSIIGIWAWSVWKHHGGVRRFYAKSNFSVKVTSK